MADTIDPTMGPPSPEVPPALAAVDREVARAYLRSEEWRLKDDRRFALIQRKNREGLPGTELAELEQLQAEARRWLDVAHPLPAFDETTLEALEHLAAGEKAAQGPGAG